MVAFYKHVSIWHLILNNHQNLKNNLLYILVIAKDNGIMKHIWIIYSLHWISDKSYIDIYQG